MGLLAVPKLLKDKYGHLYHTEHISLFAHTRVYIDIASYLYKFVCTMGCLNSRWLNSFANLMIAFRKHGVIGIPVFDGQAPAAKADEQKERRELRAKARERAEELRVALEVYETNKSALSSQQRAVLSRELNSVEKKQVKEVSLLHANNNAGSVVNDENVLLTPSDLKELKEVVFNIMRQNSSLTAQDMADLKQMLTACGVSWLQAPEESEAYCSWLVRQSYGSAVVSCDTDCLAHRADIVIFEVDSRTGLIKYVNTSELLEEWGLHEDQLIDFGILVGCDYNPGSRVNKIGPVGAIKLLREHGSIENIPDLVNIEVLQHEKIRLLFNPSYEVPTVAAIEPNDELLKELCSRRSDLDKRIMQQLKYYTCKKPTVSFMSDE